MRLVISLRLCCFFMLLACVACASDDKAPSGLLEGKDDVQVLIGKAGGIVKGKGVTLEIPAGALEKDVMIHAQVVEKDPPIGVMPVTKIYEFGPKGTKFAKDVKVSFQTEREEPAAKVYFTKEDTEEAFEKLSSQSAGKEVSAYVRHFSLGFAGIDLGTDGGAPGMDGGADAGGGGSGDGGDRGSSDAGAGVDGGVIGVPRVITVQSSDGFGRPTNQTWAAFQDGEGAWQAVAAPTSAGHYVFTVNEATFAVAFMCSDGTTSYGTILYANSTSTSHSVAALSPCVSAPPSTFKISGSVTPANVGGATFRWAHPWGTGSAPITQAYPAPSPFEITGVPAGITVDPVIGLADGNMRITKVDIARDYTLTADRTQSYDLDTQGYSTTSATFRADGVLGVVAMKAELVTRNADAGLSLVSGGGVTVAMGFGQLGYSSLVGPNFVAGDAYHFFASDDDAESYRELDLRTQTGGNISLVFPSGYAPEVDVVGGSYLRPVMTFSDVAKASEYTLKVTYPSIDTRAWEVHLPVDWLPHIAQHDGDGGPQSPSYSFAFPDLASAPNFDVNWVTVGASSVEVEAGVVTSESAFGGTLRGVQRSVRTVSIPL